MKQFHLKKGFTILSKSLVDCILRLFPTLCCPLMMTNFPDTIELSVKSSKESTELVSLLKTGNKVVEVG
jgi:hypothetical protein